MLTIIAKFKVNNVEAFLPLMNELQAKSQTEEGCIAYDLFLDVEDKSIYTLIEKWQDQAAIDLHNASEHFTTIVPKIMEVATAEINVYEAV